MRASSTALIFGDGLSGLGAACVLARAGWRVVMAEGKSVNNARYGHVHLTPESGLRQLQSLTGGTLEGWQSVDALCLSGSTDGRDRLLRPMPLIAPDALRESLLRRAGALGVEWQSIADLHQIDTHIWGWQDRQRADLLIDASGHGQALAAVSSIDIVQDEMAQRDVCHSWTGNAAGDPDAFLIIARQILGCDVALARFADGRCVMTTRGLPSPHAPQMLLDAIMLASDAAWAQRLGTISFAKTPARYSAPLARVTTVTNADALPPVLLIGDALMQTAPRFGQGISQLTQHLTALSDALENGDNLHGLSQTLHRQAEARWAGMALSAPFPIDTATVAA